MFIYILTKKCGILLLKMDGVSSERKSTFCRLFLKSHIVLQKAKCSCGSVVEHCVSSAKGCGFNSLGTHILMKNNIIN